MPRSDVMVRWLAVLPVALLSKLVAQALLGTLLLWTFPAEGSFSGLSSVAAWVRLGLYYLPPHAVFVIGGALTAPRHRAATAILLAVIGALLSLLTHVVGQHLAGNRVGSINYVHFLAESIGLLIGMAFVLWRNARAKD